MPYHVGYANKIVHAKGQEPPFAQLAKRLGLILIAFLLCISCAPRSSLRPEYARAQDIVIDVWEAKKGPLHPQTELALDTYHVFEVNFSKSAINPCVIERAIGCYYPTNDIWIDTGRTMTQRACTFQHELEHLMSLYERGDADSDHSDPVLWNEFGENTVESIACERYKEDL
jgi:hypothetical protein